VDADGGNATKLVSCAAPCNTFNYPDWAPDGSAIYYGFDADPSPGAPPTTFGVARYDLATGEATDLGAAGFQDVESLAFSPGCETLYAVDDVSDRLLTCDTVKGTCRAVGGLGVDVTDTGLAFAADGSLYMSTDAPKNPSFLYRLDPATGHATAVGPQGQEVTGLGGTYPSPACPSGLYGLGGDGRNNLVCLDTQTGQAVPVGALRRVTLNDGGLDFNAHGVLFGLADAPQQPTRVIALSQVTGSATVIATVKIGGREAGGFEGLAIEHGACAPAPPSLAALAIDAPALGGWGLAGLALALAGGGVALLRRL